MTIEGRQKKQSIRGLGERRAEEEDRHHKTGGGVRILFWLLKKSQTGIGKEDSGRPTLFLGSQGVAALALGKRALEQCDMLAS